VPEDEGPPQASGGAGVAVEADALTRRFGGNVALDRLSLRIEPGESFGLLGANGAGKTTVLKTISGAMRPQKGTVSLSGNEIQGLDPDAVARMGVAHVPEGREVFPFLSVADNLRVGAYSRKDADVAADLELVYEYFPVLKEKKSLEAGFLSGGQQQMLAIGRAMMQKPDLILLDEPSLGLSPMLVAQIAEIIQRLNAERGVTVLLVEQNARLALNISHFGYVMEIGRVVMEDTAERLRDAPDIQEFYLGMKDEGVRGRRRWKQRKTWR
jgi:branched-chain amino acid transport system ATP-binding protein